MSRQRDDSTWLLRGKQRTAVARVLRKPMTATEVCAAARKFSPRIQLRDVWLLMNDLQKRGLVICHNPRLVTGRLYELTPRGRDACLTAIDQRTSPAPSNVDWRKYSHVVRAKTRRITLLGLDELETKHNAPHTATEVRKHLRVTSTAALNHVIRAIRDLVELDLVRQDGVTKLKSCKLYRLTPAGKRISAQLRL